MQCGTWPWGQGPISSRASQPMTVSRPAPDLVVQRTERSGLEGHIFCRFHPLPFIQSHPKQSFTDAYPHSAWRRTADGPGPVTWWVSSGVGGYAEAFTVDLPPGGHVRSPYHRGSACIPSPRAQRNRHQSNNKKARMTPSDRHSAGWRFRKDR